MPETDEPLKSKSTVFQSGFAQATRTADEGRGGCRLSRGTLAPLEFNLEFIEVTDARIKELEDRLSKT
jgi:hypothetical protein